MCMHMCVETRGCCCVLPQWLSALLFETVSHWYWGLSASQAEQGLPGSAYIQRSTRTPSSLGGCWESELRSLCLCGKHFADWVISLPSFLPFSFLSVIHALLWGTRLLASNSQSFWLFLPKLGFQACSTKPSLQNTSNGRTLIQSRQRLVSPTILKKAELSHRLSHCRPQSAHSAACGVSV